MLERVCLSSLCFWNDDDDGASCQAQVADQFGLADAVRVNNNLATAQGKKDTPGLIDVKGLGRPKEFTGREGGFPTVVDEGGGILCWRDPGV